MLSVQNASSIVDGQPMQWKMEAVQNKGVVVAENVKPYGHVVTIFLSWR